VARAIAIRTPTSSKPAKRLVAGECVAVFRKWWWFWRFPQDNVFQIDLPNKKSETCPVGTIPVYRLGNQRVDSNHRYTTSAAIRTQMLDAGL
jgi:hypothetical protein